jgi:ferric-dicitrate binding protein FerR (iron transport regulator)
MSDIKNFENIEDLIFSFLRSTITPKEKGYLKAWLAEDKANKDYFREIYLLWKAGSIADQNLDTHKINQAFQKTNYKIIEAEKDDLLNDSDGRIRLTFFKLAASLFVALGIGALLSYMFVQGSISRNDNSIISEINVPLGSKSKITLPDKTVVWLNAGSKLTYSKAYGKKLREVNLEGEGYFKVAKNADKPFIVHTSKANIKALGTEFNVKAYPDENTIETILVEGSVVVNKVSASEQDEEDKSIVLKPGQKVLIYKSMPQETIASTANDNLSPKSVTITRVRKEMSPLSTDAEVETSWKNASWVIQGESLKELLVKIGRRFNVSIDLKNSELNKYKFSGIIESETLEQVFDYMSLTIPMSYSIEKGKVEIKLNKKLEIKYKDAYKN